MVPNFQAISGWNNTKLRLEPPQRDKAGDSLNLSGINWTHMDLSVSLFFTWCNVCICIYIYIFVYMYIYCMCVCIYIYVHTESYGHPSPSLKTHGMGGCCVFFKIEHGNNSLSQISQCSKIEAMSLRVRRKTRTLGKHSKLMLTRVQWVTQVALKLRLPRSVLIKVWNYMLRCCPGFMQSFAFSGPWYSGRLANCISNSFSKNGCPPSAINQYSPWNYSYQLAGTLALTRKVIFPNGFLRMASWSPAVATSLGCFLLQGGVGLGSGLKFLAWHYK